MKTKIFVWSVMATVIALTIGGCQPKNNDSKEIAEGQNEERFENTSLENDSEFAVLVAE